MTKQVDKVLVLSAGPLKVIDVTKPNLQIAEPVVYQNGLVDIDTSRPVQKVATKMAAKRVCVGDTLVGAPGFNFAHGPLVIAEIVPMPSGRISLRNADDSYYTSGPDQIVEIIEG